MNIWTEKGPVSGGLGVWPNKAWVAKQPSKKADKQQVLAFMAYSGVWLDRSKCSETPVNCQWRHRLARNSGARIRIRVVTRSQLAGKARGIRPETRSS
jgi:hypothetical protein